MTTQTLRFLIGSVFALSLVVYGAPWGTGQVVSAQDQSLFVAYIDSEGAPVTDMEAKNVIIQWDEVECEIVELEPINWPLRVTVMVDTGTEATQFLPDMRVGVESFLDALSPDVEVAIGSIGGGRVQYMTQHTSDREVVLDAVRRLSPAGNSSAFFDGLYEVAEDVDNDRDREYFPVVVMVAVGGAEGSTQHKGKGLQETMDRLNASGGAVHTLLLTNPSSGGQRSVGRAQAQWGERFRGGEQRFLRTDSRPELVPHAVARARREAEPEAHPGQQSVPGDLQAAEGCVRPAAHSDDHESHRSHDVANRQREHPTIGAGES